MPPTTLNNNLPPKANHHYSNPKETCHYIWQETLNYTPLHLRCNLPQTSAITANNTTAIITKLHTIYQSSYPHITAPHNILVTTIYQPSHTGCCFYVHPQLYLTLYRPLHYTVYHPNRHLPTNHTWYTTPKSPKNTKHTEPPPPPHTNIITLYRVRQPKTTHRHTTQKSPLKVIINMS